MVFLKKYKTFSLLFIYLLYIYNKNPGHYKYVVFIRCFGAPNVYYHIFKYFLLFMGQPVFIYYFTLKSHYLVGFINVIDNCVLKYLHI